MMDMLQSDSDWDSFSDSASSDGTEELDFLYGREAHSIFSSLEESIGKIDDFLSFERGYIHGDIVSSVADPSGQMGRVMSIKMFVDLESTHGRIIRDVDSEILLKIRSISVGDYVVHGPWIGKVEKVVDSVTVVLDDGTTCDVIALDPERLLPISSNLLEDSAYPYYPGQRLQVRLSAVTKSARWLCGTRKENQDAGTVSSVEAGLVYVDWRACALVGCDLSLPSPPRLQDAKNMTLLSCFSHEYWQLGDWCMLPMSGCKGMKDQILLDASTLELIEEHKNIGRGFKREEFSLNSQELFVIVKTKATVDVVWQDGGCSLGLDSQALLPINVVNPHEFWPGQFVIEKGTSDDPRASGSKKWGVVNAVDAKERTVKVTWKSCEVNRSNDGDSAQMVETVSAYELVEDPDYSFCYGDVVFKNVGQVVKDQANMEAGLNNNTALKGEDCQKELFTYSSKDYLLSIGCVTGFINGAVEVAWASGLKTKVSPSDIFRADKYEDQTMTLQQHEQNVEEVNGEMIDYAKQVSSLKGDLLNSNGVSEEKKMGPQESSSSFLPQCSIGFFKSMATSIFGSFGSTSLSCPISHGSISEDENAANTPKETGMLEMCDPCTEMQNHEMVNLKVEANDFQETTELRSSCANENRGRFLQFDIVGDCSDHHFLDGTGKGLTSSQMKRGWLKKVQQEWNVLEKDLPESIYVRVYEEKMELLRAAIIGAPGTPYHDGLFFFDIYLPPEYPHEPPLVYYRSGGLRVNPNLYESGKVCLSLLNTWTGTGSEVWNPESSSILQVLLSLQALVLNEKPYFNEAGYDKQMGRAEGEKNSVSYNENAYLMTWKSMLYLLRHPPKHFDTLVEEHLTRRSQHILMACKAYMEGAPLAFESGKLEQGNPNGGSTGFKLMLTKLVPKLVEAFPERGIDCSQSVVPEE